MPSSLHGRPPAQRNDLAKGYIIFLYQMLLVFGHAHITHVNNSHILLNSIFELKTKVEKVSDCDVRLCLPLPKL